MLRTSRRQQIIQAAIGIIEQRSVEALTFESVAAAAGISKSGIIYHFPTRHDLLRGVNQHFIDQWRPSSKRWLAPRPISSPWPSGSVPWWSPWAATQTAPSC